MRLPELWANNPVECRTVEHALSSDGHSAYSDEFAHLELVTESSG